MTVKMCVKHPQQLRKDEIGLIKCRDMWNQRHPIVKKPQSTRGRHGVTVKHPYLINSNSETVAIKRKVQILFNFRFSVTDDTDK